MGDGLLEGEIFMILKEVKILIKQWRSEDNQSTSSTALGYRSLPPEGVLTMVTNQQVVSGGRSLFIRLS